MREGQVLKNVYMSVLSRERLDDLARANKRTTSAQALVYIQAGLAHGMPIRMPSGAPEGEPYILGMGPGDVPDGGRPLSVYMEKADAERIKAFQHSYGFSKLSQAIRVLIEVGIARSNAGTGAGGGR